MASRSAEPSPRTCSWPTKSSRVCGRMRRASGAVSGRRSWAASEKRSPMSRKYAPHVASHEAAKVPPGHGSDDSGDEFAPILPGPGASDYERDLRGRNRDRAPSQGGAPGRAAVVAPRERRDEDRDLAHGHARAPVALGVHAVDQARSRTRERLRLAGFQRGAEGVAGARL